MDSLRILAFGDNHGNAESLRQLVDQTEGEEFDFIIHTGDLTDAWNQGLNAGVDQLEAIEPHFEALARRAPLVYIYGNRDHEQGGPGEEGEHVADHYDLSPGHCLPADERIEVDGQSFSSDPHDARPDDILLTHGPNDSAFYNRHSRAYFCGHTHSALERGHALNTGYLQKVSKGREYLGAYFTIDLDEQGVHAEVHGIDEQWTDTLCDEHLWYGRQFHSARFGCGPCKFGTGREIRPMVERAYVSLVRDGEEDRDSATVDDLVVEARRLYCDHDQYVDEVRSYLNACLEIENPGPYDRLVPVEESDTRLTEQY